MKQTVHEVVCEICEIAIHRYYGITWSGPALTTSLAVCEPCRRDLAAELADHLEAAAADEDGDA